MIILKNMNNKLRSNIFKIKIPGNNNKKKYEIKLDNISSSSESSDDVDF